MFEKLLYFIDGPFLVFVFYLLGIGVGLRILVFVSNIFKNRPVNDISGLKNGLHLMAMIFRTFLPFHKGMLKQPLYTVIRYVFHICLFIVPIWYSRHIDMIYDSSLEWYWEPFSDETIENMTLLVIGIGLFFIARRLIIPTIRKKSSIADFLIILVTIAPFVTGYCYVYGTLDEVPFLGDYMWDLHVLTGELMILMVVFLFVRTRLSSSACVGCASCTIACPTGTLEARDNGSRREFFYSHYQCICCAACAATCPEGAAELRHEVSLVHYISFFRKQKIKETDLIRCNGCHTFFAPDRQLEKIQHLIKTNGLEPLLTLTLCSRCKKSFSNKMD